MLPIRNARFLTASSDSIECVRGPVETLPSARRKGSLVRTDFTILDNAQVNLAYEYLSMKLHNVHYVKRFSFFNCRKDNSILKLTL